MITSSFKPQPGRFLISEPFMGDPNFQRTVVLLVEHNTEGSLGFVMNRQLSALLHDLVEDAPYCAAPVFMGGPVEQNTLHFVHRRGDLPGAREVVEGLYWSGDLEQLKLMIEDGEVDAKEILFFVGYSGWSPGQLDTELERKSWIVAPENIDFVFTDDYEELWQEILRNMGEKYKVISNYPIDPRLN